VFLIKDNNLYDCLDHLFSSRKHQKTFNLNLENGPYSLVGFLHYITIDMLLPYEKRSEKKRKI